MKTGNIKNIKTVKKYSNALFQKADEENSVEKIYNDVVFVCETIDTNKRLYEFLINPVISKSDKTEVITKIFSPHCSVTVIDFLCILAENGRLNLLDDIVKNLSDKIDEKKNIIKPVIISAVELSEEQKNRIKEKLSIKFKKTLFPKFTVNPEIIGGLVIENGDMTIDCSINTRFENMKKYLTKGRGNGDN